MPPTSDIFTVQDIPGAGRGVLAQQPTPADTHVLTSPRPAAHVIFRQYRKEVCAHCFGYDRGRTLPVKDSDTGKVFCTEGCKQQWKEDEGSLGVEAWQGLETFVRSRSKAIVSTLSEHSVGAKPGEQAVLATWEEAEEIASMHRKARCSGASNSGPGIKADKEYRKSLHHVWTQLVDPDIMAYLLSGIIFHNQFPEQYESEVATLAMDPEPYKDNADLEAHCNAFLQLIATVPRALVPSCTTQVCQALSNAGSHNSFGIRAGGDDGEEYMGYSLYPEASYFNHSCAPNISKKRVGRQWQFQTARDVAGGEQLCITYLGGDEKDMTVKERRDRLKGVWGFECMCERCRQEDTS
ncbi:hypothetical protein Q7P37_001730 [Cladosporium fusiforme]